MADNLKYAQLQPFTLAGSGISIGATTITLTSFLSIDGAPLTMADFGTIGYGTLEPNSFQQEEQISFTGITQNLNGSATLTGVKNVDFLYPYTETAGVTKSHAGGVAFVITNTSGFYNTFTNKNDDETILGAWVFPNVEPNRPQLAADTDATIATSLITYGQLARAVFGAVPSASTTVNGTVELATAAELAAGTAVGGTGAFLVPANSSFNATPASSLVPVATSNGVIDQGWVDIICTSGEAINAAATPQAVYLKESDGKVYKTTAASAAETLYRFIGFVAGGQNVAINTTVKVRVKGSVSGFAGLTTGADYFVTDAVGGISTTGGTFKFRVAQAISTTSIVIALGSKTATGVFQAITSGTESINLGFRPTSIQMYAVQESARNYSQGSWSESYTNRCVYQNSSAGTGGFVSDIFHCEIDGGNKIVGDISNVTSTGFDVTIVETGAIGDCDVVWTAIGV